MQSAKYPAPRFSLAEKAGVVCIPTAVILLLLGSPTLALFPPAIFLGLCLVAPFLPRFSFFLPIISRGRTGTQAIALTFDDGPSMESTPLLLNLLGRYHLKATFFVTGKRAFGKSRLLKEIIANGHSIGNHTFSHDSLLMLRNSKRLRREIETTQYILRRAGIVAHAFRPPIGVTNPRLKGILADFGLYTVNFNCRIFDRGNKRIRGLSEKVLSRISAGDIVVLHDTMPADKDQARIWLIEIEWLFQGLKAKEFTVMPLEEMIGVPVMGIAQRSPGSCPGEM